MPTHRLRHGCPSPSPSPPRHWSGLAPERIPAPTGWTKVYAIIEQSGAAQLVGDLKVLDLVTEKGREARKAYLDDGGKVDIIIALDGCSPASVED